MRLIDADAIPEKEMNYPVWVCLKKQPIIDAVPVVRCKDCKNYGHNFENDTYCKSVNGLTDPEEDDFCSYGEPKEDAE